MTKTSLIGKLIVPLILLVVLVRLARWVYDTLLPLVPSLLTAVGLLFVVAILTRVWRR